MDEGTVTHSFAATFVDELARSGLQHCCLAPGSRSAPLAMAVARHPGIRSWTHLDERSAAFFGLGMARATGNPVALLCTSGTAAAEFHPAVLEAYHAGVPLVVLTADRPPELREVGANQAVDQARLYGSAVRWFFDPGPPEGGPGAPRRWRQLAARALAEAAGPPPGPVHLNLPFREPLVPPPGQIPEAEPVERPARVWAGAAAPPEELVEELAAALEGARRPLVVAGDLACGQRLRRPLAALLARCDAPLVAEPTSQLRCRGIPGLVWAADALLRDAGWAGSHRSDLVLRLGAPPTQRALAGYLSATPGPVWVLDPLGWRDPDRLAHRVVRCDPAALLRAVAARLRGAPGEWRRTWVRAGSVAARALRQHLSSACLHEGHVVAALARTLPSRAQVLIGSSLAVREADSFWPAAGPDQRFFANRGASGIDGLVSTGLGLAAADPDRPTVLLLGDLSLYHDMNGLWAIRRHRLRATVVVLDNDGGGIFHLLPQAGHPDVFEELFGTPLGLQLEDVARLYGLEFVQVDEAGALDGALRQILTAGPALLSARFGRAQSAAAHRRCWDQVGSALSDPGGHSGQA
jgi:2-succinyl-5-enolpyruvyl-6-hydroxy-3-cyclohexene-1-carboxylate synthase